MTNHNNRNAQSAFIRAIKKFFYSAFVAVTFLLYALENRGTPAVSSLPATNGSKPAPAGTTATPAGSVAGSAVNTGSTAAAAPTATAAATTAAAAPIVAAPATATAPAATATSSSGYKDGTYTGSEVDIRWGFVQVQTTVQGGQITNVQFLEYPNERSTSVRINSVAVPELQQEAIQAQSANVNLITGATLTSEGFQQSLQSALTQAKG